jgi:hypothetical protein
MKIVVNNRLWYWVVLALLPFKVERVFTCGETVSHHTLALRPVAPDFVPLVARESLAIFDFQPGRTNDCTFGTFTEGRE